MTVVTPMTMATAMAAVPVMIKDTALRADILPWSEDS
jgi:hypothetical protein